MKFLSSVIALVVFSSLTATAADPDLKARDEVAQFIKSKLIGKTVGVTNPREEDQDFSQTWTWTNLAITEKGITFDELVTIKQTVYALDADGKRTGSGKNRDRSYANTNAIGQLDGTQVLLGIKTPLVSSFRDTTGSAYTVDAFKIVDDKLYIEFTDALPTSWPKSLPDVGYDQIKSKHTETIWVDADGKLNRKFTQVTSYIDLATGKVLRVRKPWESTQKEL